MLARSSKASYTWLCHRPAVWPQANHFTSVCLFYFPSFICLVCLTVSFGRGIISYDAMSMQHQPQESFNLCWDSEAQCKTYSYSVVQTVYITILHRSVAEWSEWATAPRFAKPAFFRSSSMYPGTLPTEWARHASQQTFYIFIWVVDSAWKVRLWTGCFALKICFECAFLVQWKSHAVRGLPLLHMTMPSAKENELLYFSKIVIKKRITGNVMSTPHIYKVL